MINPVADVVASLFVVQGVLILGLRATVSEAHRKWTLRFAAFAILTFFLVWGGYGIDAWRTLGRFDHQPRLVDNEHLFWWLGHLLGMALKDPWPLKVITALGLAILVLAYSMATRESSQRTLFVLIVFLATPASGLLFGNAVRQGVAGSIVVMGIVLWIQRHHVAAIVTPFLAVLSHLMTGLAVLAIAGGILFRRFALPLFILSFAVSPALLLLASTLEADLAAVVRYSSYQEGDFHFFKAAIATLVAGACLFSLRFETPSRFCFRHAYVFMVAAANAIIVYEVPFERMLLFADLILPLAIAEIVFLHEFLRARITLIASVVAFGGLVIWSSNSVMQSFGYG